MTRIYENVASFALWPNKHPTENRERAEAEPKNTPNQCGGGGSIGARLKCTRTKLCNLHCSSQYNGCAKYSVIRFPRNLEYNNAINGRAIISQSTKMHVSLVKVCKYIILSLLRLHTHNSVASSKKLSQKILELNDQTKKRNLVAVQRRKERQWHTFQNWQFATWTYFQPWSSWCLSRVHPPCDLRDGPRRILDVYSALPPVHGESMFTTVLASLRDFLRHVRKRFLTNWAHCLVGALVCLTRMPALARAEWQTPYQWSKILPQDGIAYVRY